VAQRRGYDSRFIEDLEEGPHRTVSALGGKRTLAAARAGRLDDLLRIYAGQLELPQAMAESAQMLSFAREKPSELLCYERDPTACHRTLLLAAVAPDAEVIDLFA
jgi:hypothetical protein